MVGRRDAFILSMLVAAGCGGDRQDDDSASSLPACGDGPLFSVSPLAPADFMGLTPLGHLAPSGHTFPTDHMYFYTRPGSVVPVVSPGEVTVVVAALMQASGGHTDYQLYFKPCRDYMAYYDHVTTLSEPLAAQIGSFDDATCMTYGDPAQAVPPMREEREHPRRHRPGDRYGGVGHRGRSRSISGRWMGGCRLWVTPIQRASPATIDTAWIVCTSSVRWTPTSRAYATC